MQTHARLTAMGAPISWGDVVQWDPSKTQTYWDQSIKSQKDFGANLDQTTKHAHDAAEQMRHLDEDIKDLKIGALDPFLSVMTAAAKSAVQLAGGLSGVARGIEAVARAWANATAKGIPQNVIPLSVGAGVGQSIMHGLGIGGGGAAKPTPSTQPPPTTHPSAAAPPPGAGVGKGIHWDVATSLYQMLVGLGANPEATRGAVGVLGSESMGFNPGARPWSKKEHRYLSSARGLGQWLKDRINEYQKATGLTVGEDVASQEAMMTWELLHSPRKGVRSVLRRLMAATTAGQGADIWEQFFEGITPGTAGVGGRHDYEIDKGAYHKYLLGAGGMAPTVGTQNNTFNIRATDPKGTGREVVAVLSHTSKTARYMRGGPAV
jgi:hypothetical protein